MPPGENQPTRARAQFCADRVTRKRRGHLITVDDQRAMAAIDRSRDRQAVRTPPGDPVMTRNSNLRFPLNELAEELTDAVPGASR